MLGESILGWKVEANPDQSRRLVVQLKREIARPASPALKAPPPRVMDRVASAAADGEWETF